jgi:16S rRNA (adenine1518-N6/adenine1519-N6)-dimethyltransferase
MNLSEMRQILKERGIQLTKSLGQNFLHDGNQLRRIVDAAELSPMDRVLEVGPGLGPLTELLVERAGEVLAIEKDARLCEVLRERMRNASSFRLLHGDAMDHLRATETDWSEWKLVANLPYSVASPILVELAQTPKPPKRMVVTLQLEVVRRLVAEPSTKDYGLLTLLIQLRYRPEGWFKIPSTCFHPPPEVDSGCVTLARREEPLLSPEHEVLFTRIVRAGFSQRRKMMRKLLRGAWPQAALEGAFEQTGIPLQTRAEAVSLEQFVRLTARLAGSLKTLESC